MNALEALKTYFGYTSFRRGQAEIVEAILAGRDALAIMPTGAGKSICYQVPALLLPGVTLVVSPLIALMQDQVKALVAAGIHAAYINSSLTEGQLATVYARAAQGAYKIIYVAPERLETHGFRQMTAQLEISMVTVDEAHCISQWGQDFRPSYLRITEYIDSLPKRPVVAAFTATATPAVIRDIRQSLGLREPRELVTGFDRPNLYFDVQTPGSKDEAVLDYLESHPGESGIIYCATRKNVDKLAGLLSDRGIPALGYHAGMESGVRRENQSRFVYDEISVMVATNAFGMGIDKSNVRFVIHYNMPQSIENYYQEAGRAGRDGEPAACILLFSPQDVAIGQFLLEKNSYEDMDPAAAQQLRSRDLARLRTMEGYARSQSCLRNTILAYFGESRRLPCGSCGNCCQTFLEEDRTEEARQIMVCVRRAGGTYGASTILDILQGRNLAKLRQIRADRWPVYGVLRGVDRETLQLVTEQMIREGYLIRSEEYSQLQFGPDAESFSEPGARLWLRRRQTPSKEKKKPVTAQQPGPEDPTLFRILRELRRTLAGREKIPPYMVFSDRTLREMTRILPQTPAQLMQVSGVGEAKIRKYGAQVLEAVREYCQSRG